VVARWFNTAGPCEPIKNYMLPAAARLPEVPALVERESYFVVHAPRQTGKTTALRALASDLTAGGHYAAVVLSLETGRAWGDDVGAATRAVLDRARSAARANLPPDLRPPEWPDASAGGLMSAALTAWAQACPRPLVLFLDEIDALTGRTLISVLSQLRDGYQDRPGYFPASVALCGLRDVREYKAASGGDSGRLGTASPFNIKLTSLRLGDFTLDEVRALYAQHTEEVGQEFTAEASECAFELTAGQPWLVNALAHEMVSRMRVPVTQPITADHVEIAKERLIRARETHLDSLVDKLREPRVRRVMEVVLAGGETVLSPFADDLLYVRDLGLIAQDSPARVANPIYREIIPRVLTDTMLDLVSSFPSPRSFVRRDGRFDVTALLTRFAEFWRNNEEILTAAEPYRESTPHLTLMGYLDRAVNGDGVVDREYGVGRGRVDLLLRWFYPGPDGARAVQREAFELKTRRPGDADPVPGGLSQLDAYLDRLGLPTGYLVVFDQRPGAAEDVDELLTNATSPAGRSVTVARI
jgi:hypothetical protein